MPEKNALAELAEELRVMSLSVFGSAFREEEEILDKSYRIVAELAKIVDCKHPYRIMPIDKPYDDVTVYMPFDIGLTEANSINEDEQRFILDLANAAWNCRAIAEE